MPEFTTEAIDACARDLRAAYYKHVFIFTSDREAATFDQLPDENKDRWRNMAKEILS